jgi:restriction system protein
VNKKKTRTTKKKLFLGVKLTLLGLAFICAQMMLPKSFTGGGIGAFFWIGLSLLLCGGAVIISSYRSLTHANIATTINNISANKAESPAVAVMPEKPSNWTVDVFEKIEWRRFEALTEKLFQQGGFATKSQSHGPDDGVDVWLYLKTPGESPIGLVQCKHWRGKLIGVDKVRELRGVMAAQNIKRGHFVTSSSFSKEASAFAVANNIQLLNLDDLMELILKRSEFQQSELLQVALEGQYWIPTCAQCGTKMVDRKPKNGGKLFWGCSTFPKCKNTLPMRGASH